MNYLDAQVQQTLDVRDYKVVICVFGSRYWGLKPEHRRLFHESVIALLEEVDGPVLFVSGAAPSGADDLIIQWCRKFRFPCKEMPAAWNRPDGSKDKGAGFKRNDDMSRIITHGLGFWDGISPGTVDMANRCLNRGVMVRLINIGDMADLPPIGKQKLTELPAWKPSEKLIHALDEEDDDDPY